MVAWTVEPIKFNDATRQPMLICKKSVLVIKQFILITKHYFPFASRGDGRIKRSLKPNCTDKLFFLCRGYFPG